MRPRAGLRRLGAVVAVLLVVLLPLAADAAVLKRGSRGDEVVTLQKKLKQWGYYDGSVDGVFGAGTEKAVQYFQRKNGLTADGIVGTKTAAALGMTLSGSGQTAQADNSSDRRSSPASSPTPSPASSTSRYTVNGGFPNCQIRNGCGGTVAGPAHSRQKELQHRHYTTSTEKRKESR